MFELVCLVIFFVFVEGILLVFDYGEKCIGVVLGNFIMCFVWVLEIILNCLIDFWFV